jgi:hypothetical protein
MRRIALIASILLLAPGCDKTSPEDPQGPTLAEDLAGATVLFQVFGAREEPRIAPIAIVRGGTLAPLTLSTAHWREFDSLYFSVGARVPVYRQGAQVGELEIVRGMWTDGGPALYQVPGCSELVPQAIGRLHTPRPMEESVELLATSVPVEQSSDTRAFPRQSEADAQGRSLASAVAAGAQIGPEDLSGLDFHARWIRTGVGRNGRTLLTSYIDPNAGDLGPGAGNTAVILALAEDSASVMNTSYQHALSGEARTVEFQRLLNFADLNGDGASELVLEAWRYAGIPSLAVLSYSDGQWRETFRVGLDWCVGTPPR